MFFDGNLPILRQRSASRFFLSNRTGCTIMSEAMKGEEVSHAQIFDCRGNARPAADGDHRGLAEQPALFDFEELNYQLRRRQKGYGRGRRMQIEKDTANVVGGVRHGKTTGAPVALVVENKDWKNWTDVMSIEPIEGRDEVKRRVHRPRPGHADLNGGLKYNHEGSAQRAGALQCPRDGSKRRCAARWPASCLSPFGIKVAGHVIRIGEVEAKRTGSSAGRADPRHGRIARCGSRTKKRKRK